jgi:hypothetical protein
LPASAIGRTAVRNSAKARSKASGEKPDASISPRRVLRGARGKSAVRSAGTVSARG